MAVTNAEGGAGGDGYRLFWTLAFDDVADTVTLDATHTRNDAATTDPQVAQITVQLNSGQPLSVNLLTGLVAGQPFSQTQPGEILNAGPRTRTGVKLSLSTGRAKIITFSTQYQPPA